MPQDQNHLIWIDMEMTGLEPETDRVIEIAVVITDSHLNLIAEGPTLVVHQSDAVMDAMDEWCTKTHGNSGLTAKVKASTLTEAEVEAQVIEFISQYCPKGVSPLCGNSVHQDRRFLVKYMPTLESWFHYRNLDVSTLKELCKRWKPEVAKQFKKRGAHTALADILESIDELKFYRDHFIKLAGEGVDVALLQTEEDDA
ncbi:oligoribonuclease [Chitinibacter sp. GC72]|uniref:oligoribonuclease n=1 Tax=Chitinibacter sp. GC72 TaxID=1526917 RepID=UPI0012F827DA|nr:oligoribonuclease [Chitinibacter sp. GC72]